MSAEGVTVVGLASVAASEIEVVSSDHQAPSKRKRRSSHSRNRLGGSAGSNAPLLRDEDLNQLRAEYATGQEAPPDDLDEPVLMRHPSNQAEPGTPRVAHVTALVSDDASDVVASVLARPVAEQPLGREELPK